MDGLSIAASLTELRPEVEEGWIRAIYQPTRAFFVIHVFGREKRRLLISPREAAIHLTELDIANPEQPSPFVMLLRKHLRGGRIESVRQRGLDRVVTFEVVRRIGRIETRYTLVAELAGLRGGLLLLREGLVLGASRPDPRYAVGASYVSLPLQDKLPPETVTPEDVARFLQEESPARALARAIDGVGRETAGDLVAGFPSSGLDRPLADAERIACDLRRLAAWMSAPEPHLDPGSGRAAFYPLPPPAAEAGSYGAALDAAASFEQTVESPDTKGERSLRRTIERHERTAVKLRDWLDEAAKADRLQALGDLLMIHHRDVAPKSEVAELVDPATEESVRVRLIPSLSAIENAQRYYGRAKRLRRGVPHVRSRLAHLEAEIARLRQEEPIPEPEREPTRVDEAQTEEPRKGCAFDSETVEGFTLWIGRNAADNDRMLRVASPTDLWLHVIGHSGSHVIVRRGGRTEIPQTVIEAAARHAAKRSKARSERRAQVTVAEVRHVRKPKGAPAGLVHVGRADTLTVEMEGEA